MASNDQNFGGQNPPSCQGFGNPQNTDSLQDSQVQGLDNIQNPGNTQALRPSQIYGTQYTRFSRDELRSYDQMRRQTYPNTYNEEYPTDQVESDKLAYDEHTKNANSSMNKYWKEFKRNTRSEERDAKLEDLHPIHHSNLVSPAAQAAIDTSRNAQGRVAFLNQHRHGYVNAKSRKSHEKRADRASDEAHEFRSRYDEHLMRKQ